MSEATYPIPLADLLTTLKDLFRHQQRQEMVELIESAHARIDQVGYDNWNGGTYEWALRLEVPVSVFASIESRLEAVEKEIAVKLSHFDKLHPNDHLHEVTITPLTPGTTPLGQHVAPREADVQRLWPDHLFRLFLSHVSVHKQAASALKQHLAVRGIAAFVAHEDIEPSLEWQREIELALQSMHALAALFTPEFRTSKWTDHEVGWALGRGVLVLPVRLGLDPYGLAGKIQAVSGDLSTPSSLADAIARILLARPETRREMRHALVVAFSKADSFDAAKKLRDIVVTVDDFRAEELALLYAACDQNLQVKRASGVCASIYQRFGQPAAMKPEQADIPF